MNRVTRSLTNQLLSIVALSAVSYMAIAVVIITSFGLANRGKQLDEFKSRLALTVSGSASIALFADNQQIADEVLDALLLHEEIEQARIVSSSGATFSKSKLAGPVGELPFSFALQSPVDGKHIGYIQLKENEEYIREQTFDEILYQISFLLFQWVVVFVVIVWVVQRVIGQPLTELARELLWVKPGSSKKIQLKRKNRSNEIGLVTRSINQFVESTDSAIQREKSLRLKVEEMEQHYRHIAQFDNLTQLKNRLGCEVAIAQLESPYLALLIIDLDGFKLVNDRFGHAAGDTVLVKIAKRFQMVARGSGIVGRMGGDEFIVVLPLDFADEKQAEQVASALIRASCKKIVLNGNSDVHIGASIGISFASIEEYSLEKLMLEADHAMYHVKESGKNAYCFYSTLTTLSSNI
ncbi:diguanylate cyclase [Vibrio paucivorans]|uniref:Diguanylate cyclase n=1 Tax=Vibrio paucivorans TaxID=2829489 RepID=A0A9X3CDI2_9VIBR|nr:diguanylate cyclase [Vibrio paucivorans]MCW8333667.1 diguanylate cyclase [Vibrio paucivorans]